MFLQAVSAADPMQVFARRMLRAFWPADRFLPAGLCRKPFLRLCLLPKVFCSAEAALSAEQGGSAAFLCAEVFADRPRRQAFVKVQQSVR